MYHCTNCTKVCTYWPSRYEEYCAAVYIVDQPDTKNIIYHCTYCTRAEVILLTNWPIRYQGYLTSVLLAWMNARCVSFSLDRIWGKITINHIKYHQGFVRRYLMYKWKSFHPGLVPSEPIGLAFLHLVSYCFYLPLGIMGPLVSSQTYRESFLRTPPPINR